MVTTSSNKGFSVPSVGGDTGIWGGELNTTITDLDTILGGSITFNASAAATVTLAASQAQFNRVVFTGTPASSMVLNIMSSTITGGYGNFDIWNNTSTSANSAAGFNVLCQVNSTSTGTTVTIPVNNMRLINVDSQNVQLADQVIIPVTTLPPILNKYLGGLAISNSSSNASNALFMAAGLAADSSAAEYLQSAATFNKSASAVWAQGSGNGGMGSGLTFTAATTYHVYIISNGGSSNIDFYFDTSLTAANKPAATNAFRRIASMKSASSAAVWNAFTQTGDSFLWKLPITDVNTTLSASPTAATLTVPSGLILLAWGTASIQPPGSNGDAILQIYSPNQSTPPSIDGMSRARFNSVATQVGDSYWQSYTNTSGQITYSGGGTAGTITTYGWFDVRGK